MSRKAPGTGAAPGHGAAPRWWHPECLAARLPTLELRGRVTAAIRAHFREQGFSEVETPGLQISPGMEPHIMALSAELHEPLGGGARRLYLHTSPEFAMKKLLAAGLTAIFQLARVWRDGERSPLHHPEFTLLEWYRAGMTYGQLIEDCVLLLRRAAQAAEVAMLRRGEHHCDPFAAPEILTVAQAFQRRCGIDLLATAPNPLQPDRDRLAAEAKHIGLHVGDGDSWEDVFHRIMLERIEPHLGQGAPTFLTEYPLPLAALARPSARDPRVAERFELYACGVELANAFGELTDPAEQRRRFEAEMAEKARVYGECYPIDEELIAALAEMPPASGGALGFDRLVMLATGATHIEQVLWTPLPD